LKKLSTFCVFAAAVLLAIGAQAQEFHGAFGFGTVKAPGVSTDANGNVFPSLSGGLYPSFSGIFILKHHIGFGGEVSWRAHRAIYTQAGSNFLFQAPYRPIFYDFNAVYGRQLGKKFGVDVMAGIGGEDLRFYTPFFTCGAFSGCTNYQSSNHFAGHFSADIRYYVWGHLFVRPEAHYYAIRNNVEFNGTNVSRFAVSIGYSFLPGF
jgi:Outer membrane protein beta-barrel domain